MTVKTKPVFAQNAQSKRALEDAVQPVADHGCNASDYVKIPVISLSFNENEVRKPVEPQDDVFCAINLTDEDSDMIDAALPEAIELIRDAGEFLTFLSNGASLGHFNSDDAGYAALLRLTVRAFNAAESREIRALELLEVKHRRSMAKAIDRDAKRKQTARFTPSE